MFIFNRTTLLDRHRPMAATAAAIEIAGIVNRVTGVGLNVFGTRFGAPINTVAWSCRVESQAHLDEINAKLMLDQEYVGWLAANEAMFETAPEDSLGFVVSSTLAGAPKRYYTTLTAQAAAGKLGDVIAFGARAQQLIAEKTGLVTAFLSSVYGPFGRVLWLTGADSMADLDTLWNLQMTDADYHALVAEAGPLFLDSSGQTGLIEKLT